MYMWRRGICKRPVIGRGGMTTTHHREPGPYLQSEQVLFSGIAISWLRICVCLVRAMSDGEDGNQRRWTVLASSSAGMHVISIGATANISSFIGGSRRVWFFAF